MDDMFVREAAAKDMPAILKLLYELGRPRPGADAGAFEDMVRRYMTDSDKHIIVAVSSSDISGMIAAMLLPRLNRTSPEMYVPELVVRQKSRRQGIGRMLIDYCIKFAREKKCYRIRLESGNQRTQSHGFYRRIGFEQSALSFTLSLCSGEA